MTPGSLRIDIVSDVVCPWCLIGYRQLERALAETGLAADIHWQPFELNPAMGAQGQDFAEHVREKYGTTPEQGAERRGQMKAIAEPLGIDFANASRRIWNSFGAHQLLHWAKASGRQTALKLALFEAYFGSGRNISDEAVLLDAVEAAGLNRDEASAVLADGREAEAVRALEDRWSDRGIFGVPAFIIDGRAMVMGAQGEARLAAALRKITGVSAG